ncbi:hypothetical protein [Ignatzschineria cameli]|uniref:hypothetical protein n=1 Tax=Ignatzschineria cameli TaxID=2182793 RepID=UPI001300309C|nr:hypothetical protein [Ignatzschineria cameli]
MNLIDRMIDQLHSFFVAYFHYGHVPIKRLNAAGSYYRVLPQITCRQMAIFHRQKLLP